MRLSSLTDYAVVMMSAAARHGGTTRLSATSLSDATGVPLPTAQKLMGRLAGASGLLTSARGTGGGFLLARLPGQISVADIVEAVEGPIALTACVEGRRDCELEGNCRVKPHWSAVNAAVKGALAGVTLATLAGEIA